MPGKAERINAQLLYINGLRTGSLGCIHDQQQTVPVGKIRCAGKVDAIAGHVEAPVTTSARVVGRSSASHWS